MASESGPVVSEASPLSSSAGGQPTISAETLAAEAARVAQTLKRARETTPTSPALAHSSQANPDLSPTKVARLISGITSRHSPAPLTGAAAIEDERIRKEEQYKQSVFGASENPAFKAQSELMSGANLGMSRPQDAPAPADPGPEAQGLPPTAVSIPTTNPDHPDARADISPQSATSIGSLGGAGTHVTHSPAPMEVDSRNDRAGFGTQPTAQMVDKSNVSLSYPGVGNMPAPPSVPARQVSLPLTPNQQAGGPRSPNSKKHKCPYCDTEFTRHHNLKSHLLTHSHEKPYVCQTCQMRFRRLHDLKRHSKLHTGEKPHVCPKCDRKFARGDALARHAKGAGGCAGRRSSMGSFADEGDYEGNSQLDGDDSVMTGITYDNEADMTEEDRRRLSLPSIKAQHVAGAPVFSEGYTQHSRTYPPPGPRPSQSGGLHPPNVAGGSGSSNAPPGLPSGHAPSAMSSGAPSVYSQTGMTESPKPLSPSALQGGHDSSNIGRQRSPSLTTQFQQQHFGRHQSDRNTPPVPGFPANDTRFAASGQVAPAQGNTSAQTNSTASGQPATLTGPTIGHTRTGSNTSHPGGGSGDSTSNNIFATDQGIWAYIHSLEEKIKQLTDRVHAMEQTERSQEEKIGFLTTEVTTLHQQLDVQKQAAGEIKP